MPLGRAMHDQTVWRLAKRTKKGIALLGQAGSIRREPVAALDPRWLREQGAMLSIYGNSSGRPHYITHGHKPIHELI